MKRKIFAICAAIIFGVISAAIVACEDATPPPPAHVCGHVCPECGKCLDSTCTDPVCAEKCEGHEPTPPEEYDVTFDLDGGTGGVASAAYEAGESFALPVADGLVKGVCTLVGWNDGNDDYAPGAQYEMPDRDVQFTAVWQAAEYTFAVVADGVKNDNVTFYGHFNLCNDYIGNVAKNWNSGVAFDIDADKAGIATLRFTVSDRAGTFTFDDAYTLYLNGTVVSSDTNMSDSSSFSKYVDYDIAELMLKEGKNKIVIAVKNTSKEALGTTEDLDIAGDIKGIKLVSETLTCTPYSDPDGEWVGVKEFSALDGGRLNVGVYSNATVNGNENCLGQFNLSSRFATFTVKATEDTRAALWLNVSNLNDVGIKFFDDAFELYVGEQLMQSDAVMPRGRAQWTDYDYIRLGEIELSANVVTDITFVTKGFDFNFRGIKLVTEGENNITLTSDEAKDYGYASAWNKTDIKFATSTGSQNDITPGITVDGGVKLDNGNAWLGGISGTKDASISFTVNSTSESRAVLSMYACSRTLSYLFKQAFELKINGEVIRSFSRMPGNGDDWTSFTEVDLAEIELIAGENTVELKVISGDGGIGCNIEGMAFKTATGDVTLKQ